MRFAPLEVAGAWRIDVERIEDERGFFARTFDVEELTEHGIDASIVQESVSFNARRGTLRGMHLQAAPFEEGKYIRCTAGRIYDVLLDLRLGSATYRQWIAIELSADDHTMLFAPGGVAHGFITLTDACEVAYKMTAPHHAPAASGVRWNDPAFAIEWPMDPLVISARDASWPDHVG